MTAATERLRELVGSYAPADLPPLAAELICALDLPADLPAQLAIGEVAKAAGVSGHTLQAALAVIDYKIATYGGSCSP